MQIKIAIPKFIIENPRSNATTFTTGENRPPSFRGNSARIPQKSGFCKWDFSGITVEELLRLAWNNFKVEVRTKFFQKLLEEDRGSFDILHQKMGKGNTIKVIDAFNYRSNPQDEIQRAIYLERIKAVKTMLEVGGSEDAIIKALVKKFDCTHDEAEDIYNIAYEEQ